MFTVQEWCGSYLSPKTDILRGLQNLQHPTLSAVVWKRKNRFSSRLILSLFLVQTDGLPMMPQRKGLLIDRARLRRPCGIWPPGLSVKRPPSAAHFKGDVFIYKNILTVSSRHITADSVSLIFWCSYSIIKAAQTFFRLKYTPRQLRASRTPGIQQDPVVFKARHGFSSFPPM